MLCCAATAGHAPVQQIDPSPLPCPLPMGSDRGLISTGTRIEYNTGVQPEQGHDAGDNSSTLNTPIPNLDLTGRNICAIIRYEEMPSSVRRSTEEEPSQRRPR